MVLPKELDDLKAELEQVKYDNYILRLGDDKTFKIGLFQRLDSVIQLLTENRDAIVNASQEEEEEPERNVQPVREEYIPKVRK